MLSLGAAAFNSKGTYLGSFYTNLKPLPEAKQSPDTMRWWGEHQEAYQKATENQVDPKLAMQNFVRWVKGFNGIPVFVAYPAGFDFTFVHWYIVHFLGKDPFSFSALDIKSYAMAKLNLPYRQSIKRNYPREWFKSLTTKHTHVASDDAREQGELFFKIREYSV